MKYIKLFEDYFKDINTEEDIKKQYRKLSKEYHPDKFGGNDDVMKSINNDRDNALKRIGNKDETDYSRFNLINEDYLIKFLSDLTKDLNAKIKIKYINFDRLINRRNNEFVEGIEIIITFKSILSLRIHINKDKGGIYAIIFANPFDFDEESFSEDKFDLKIN